MKRLDNLKDKLTPNKKLNKNSVSDILGKRGYTYMGDTLSSCGSVSFGYDTMFKIQRYNTEAQQGKNKIVKMVGKHGFRFERDGEFYDDMGKSREMLRLFTDPVENSFYAFRDKYFTNHFCSGMVFGYIAKNGLGEPAVQILDSRNVRQELDKFGNLKEVFYGEIKLDLSRVVKQITQYNPNRPGYGMSAYESLVYDAMSDREASKRNFYFFKNNAMPSVILTLDDGIENEEEVTEAIRRFEDKYKGSEKSNGVLATGGIKEVRTIDFSNKDLELLELKRFAIKKMGVIYGFDPRFLGYKDDKNGSHAEYQIMANQSDKSMIDFADILEEFMMKVVQKVDPAFEYDKVDLVNDQFLDKTVKQELVEKKIEKGICTIKEGRMELGYSAKKTPDFLDTFVLNTQWQSIENIFEKAKLDQELQKKMIKEDESNNEGNGEKQGEEQEQEDE